MKKQTNHYYTTDYYRSGDSSMVRAPDSWLKGRGFESLQERRENFVLQGQLSVTLISVSVPPRVTAVARKRSRSFCQRCRWQVAAKHIYTLRMWFCMKWHGAWLSGVHRTRRDGSSLILHQPCQYCKYQASHSCRITCERSEPAREWRIALYKSDQQQQNV